jgi:hypothetical protein
MPDQPDPYAGQGGSYELMPDGSRRLLFRTGMGEVEPEAVAADPDPAPARNTKGTR